MGVVWEMSKTTCCCTGGRRTPITVSPVPLRRLPGPGTQASPLIHRIIMPWATACPRHVNRYQTLDDREAKP